MAKKFIIHLNEEICKGCGICISVCPVNVYERGDRISPKGYVITEIRHPGKCIGCKNCELMCPDQVIFIEEDADGN